VDYNRTERAWHDYWQEISRLIKGGSQPCHVEDKGLNRMHDPRVPPVGVNQPVVERNVVTSKPKRSRTVAIN